MATTINSYSVSLTMDARGYIDATRLSRSETNALTREINAARTPQEQFFNKLTKLEDAFSKGAIDLQTFTRLVDANRQKLAASVPVIDSVSQAFAKQNRELAKANQLYREQSSVQMSAAGQRFANQTNESSNSLMVLGKRLAGPIALLATLRKSISDSFEVSRARASLEVLTGSAGNAANMLKDLRQIDATSPLTFNSGLQAARTLMSFGVSVDEVIPRLKQLGDVTGADNERFKSMALAFAQVSAAGRLQGQDLRQMIDAGFNPLQEISRKTGESLIDLKARMEAGAISSQEVADAFASATGEGGKFNGMMDKMGETAAGKFGQLASRFEQLGVSLGDALAPIIIQGAELITKLLPLLEIPLFLIRKLGDGLGFILALANDVVGMFIKLGDLASGKVVTLGDMFAFENTTKMLDGMAATADAAGTTAKATGVVSANTKTAADDATRYADQMKLAAKLAEETASNQEKLEGIIRDMRTEYNEKTKIGGDLDARKKEVDAIRLLFDKTTMDDRTDANWFEHLIETGQDYNKFLDKMLDENQLAKLAEFRALANSTAELERQEQIKKEGDKLRQAMLEKARGLMRDVDPVGKYIADLKDVQALRNAGMINEKAFVMEKNRLESELLKSRGTGTKVEAAKSFEVGSQEAYKFLVDQQTGKVNEQLQEQRKQTIALEVQNRTLRDIEAKIEPMRARR